MNVRDRIVELRRVRASELRVNPSNWRKHPETQRKAMRGVLDEIGYADALLARETPDGLMLIDGHLRRETTPDVIVPVLVLDLDEREADLLLATLDPLAAMAEPDGAALAALLEGIEAQNEDVRELLVGLEADSRTGVFLGGEAADGAKRENNNMKSMLPGARVGLQSGEIMVTIDRELYERLWGMVNEERWESRAQAIEAIIAKGLAECSA